MALYPSTNLLVVTCVSPYPSVEILSLLQIISCRFCCLFPPFFFFFFIICSYNYFSYFPFRLSYNISCFIDTKREIRPQDNHHSCLVNTPRRRSRIARVRVWHAQNFASSQSKLAQVLPTTKHRAPPSHLLHACKALLTTEPGKAPLIPGIQVSHTARALLSSAWSIFNFAKQVRASTPPRLDGRRREFEKTVHAVFTSGSHHQEISFSTCASAPHPGGQLKPTATTTIAATASCCCGTKLLGASPAYPLHCPRSSLFGCDTIGRARFQFVFASLDSHPPTPLNSTQPPSPRPAPTVRRAGPEVA